VGFILGNIKLLWLKWFLLFFFFFLLLGDGFLGCDNASILRWLGTLLNLLVLGFLEVVSGLLFCLWLISTLSCLFFPLSSPRIIASTELLWDQDCPFFIEDICLFSVWKSFFFRWLGTSLFLCLCGDLSTKNSTNFETTFFSGLLEWSRSTINWYEYFQGMITNICPALQINSLKSLNPTASY